MALKLELRTYVLTYAVPMECSKLRIDVTFGVGLAQAHPDYQSITIYYSIYIFHVVLVSPFSSSFTCLQSTQSEKQK